MARERSHGRAADELRPIAVEPGFVRSATGSALFSAGETRVICTASIIDSVPKWLAVKGRGWLTAEYGMLPASTGERKQRDVSRGRPDGRTVATSSSSKGKPRWIVSARSWQGTETRSTWGSIAAIASV